VKHLIAIALSVILVGCATSENQVSYDTEKRAASKQLDIFRDGAKPDRKYREIGMLGDEGRRGEQAGIEAKILKKARAMGANAVIFLPLEKTGEEVNLGSLGLAETFAYKALAVAYE